jgi:hypothetical protein
VVPEKGLILPLLLLRHCVPASVQWFPVQQGTPVFPQALHKEVLLPGVLVVQARSNEEQVVPVGRFPLAQDGSSALPQVQRPDLHEPYV